MDPNNEDLNADLERLITAALPKLEANSQNELAYSAGLAAGRHLVQREIGSRSVNRKITSHLLCAIAASCITVVALPELHRSTSLRTVSTKSNEVDNMPRAFTKNEETSPATSPAAAILGPRTSPIRYTEFVTDRQADTAPSSNSDGEAVLSSRSILF